MNLLTALRPGLPILIGAALMLSVSMGLRQSLGVFMPALTQDIGISVSQFSVLNHLVRVRDGGGRGRERGCCRACRAVPRSLHRRRRRRRRFP
jgi:hypothetical protein